MNIKIDPEFKSYLRTLNIDERAGLERGILRDGCLDPLRVWNDLLIDGHNRYEICTANNIPFDVEKIQLENREAAINWIIDNQLDKRNLAPDEASYYRGKKYLRERREEGRPKKLTQIEAVFRTSEKLAGNLGVSRATVERDGAFAAAVDKLTADTTPEMRTKILRGEIKATKQDIIAAAKLPDDKRKDIAEKIATGEAKGIRQAVQQKNAEEKRIFTVQEAADGMRFPVIYADPPWEYSNTGFAQSVANQYPTMSTADIRFLEIAPGITVPAAATTNAVLFLWATNPLLDDALSVMAAWGFEYKTNFVWTKEQHMGGFYCLGQHELLLVGVRGSSLPKDGSLVGSHLEFPRGKHSAKPHEVYELIERMYDGPYLELFARNEREGWKSFGNEPELAA